MRLTTITTENGTSAARIIDGTVVALPYPDVVALLGDPEWRTAASSSGTDHGDASALEYNLPAVRPGKTMCCGLNYRSHVLESRTRRELPKYPTLFAKFPDTLTGALSPISCRTPPRWWTGRPNSGSSSARPPGACHPARRLTTWPA